MWLRDVYSFDGILQFLSIADIFSLKCVNIEFYKYMREECMRCTKLNGISSSEIVRITNVNLFPKLQYFDNIMIDDGMTKDKIDLLMNRWNNWSSCCLSSRTHSRRAMRQLMMRVTNLFMLNFHIDNECNRQYLAFLQPCMSRLMRVNKSSLQVLKISGLNIVHCVIHGIRTSRLRLLHMNLNVLNSYDVSRIVKSVPQTLITLELVNNRQSCSYSVHTPPFFLYELLRRDHIKHLVLINCVSYCGILCDSWNIVRHFCSETKVTSLTVSALRMDCINSLVNNQVPRVNATVIGCPPAIGDLWRKRLPLLYNLRF